MTIEDLTEDSQPLCTTSDPPATPLSSTAGSHFLDQQSLSHLNRLCEQCLVASKLSTELWKDPLLHAMHTLESTLTPELLSTLAISRTAQEKARSELARQGKGNVDSQGGTAGATWWKADEEKGKQKADETEEESMKRRRRDVWRNAAMWLPTKDDEEENQDEVPSHVRELSTASASTSADVEAWLEVGAMPKVAVLSILVRATETTAAAIKSGSASRGISFEVGTFDGSNLFGRDGPDLDEDDLRLVDRLGGTFHLTATSKGLHRLQRLVELLAFAVISLALESSLLHDISCPRPSLPTPPDTPSLSTEEDDGTTEGESDGTERDGEADTSSADPTLSLPGAFGTVFDYDEPSDDWTYTKRSWRSSFSNSGIIAWMRLANPRAEPPKTTKTSRSLRRISTAPSATNSPEPLRTTYSISTAPDSPSPSMNGKRSKVAKKIRGIRDQLREKIGRLDRSETASNEGSEDGWDQPETESVLSKGGNVGAVGLGVNLRNWTTSWSTPSTSDDVKSDAGGTDFVSEVGTEAAPEEQKEAPKRFEKVIEDLSQFSLSTSPDVLYPPPHLLFRLRQQELAAASSLSAPTPTQIPSTPPSPSPPRLRLKPELNSELFDRPPSAFLHPSMRSSALLRAHALPSTHSLALNIAGGPPSEVETRFASSDRKTTNSSTATRITLDAKAGLASLMTNNSSLGGTIRHQAMQFLVQTIPTDAPDGTPPCESPHWLVFHYYDNTSSSISEGYVAEDDSLESFVECLIQRQNLPCQKCARPNREHVLILMHNNEKIEVSMSTFDPPSDSPSVDPTVNDSNVSYWHTCEICQEMTPSLRLSRTAASFSFSKFIELVLYDSNLIPVPDLCDHASTERSALIRTFALGDTSIQIKRSSVTLFELRLPTAVDPDVEPDDSYDQLSPDSDSVESLRKEIAVFFRSVDARVAALRRRLAALPPSPPSSPQKIEADAASPDSPSSIVEGHARSDSQQTIIDNSSRPDAPSISQVVDSDEKTTPLHRLLDRLLATFSRERNACEASARDISPHEVNIGRATFRSRASAVERRLAEWESKHAEDIVAGAGPLVAETLSLDKPDYFSHDILALPLRSSVLVRTSELSSLIALTLSSPEFKDECQSGSAASSRRVTPSTPGFVSKSRQSSVRLPIPSFPLDEPAELDPDEPTSDYSIHEPFEVMAKPKKPARGTGSMLRNLVRKKSGEIGSGSSTPLATPTSENGTFNLDSKRRVIKDSVLDDFLKTKDAAPSTSRSEPRSLRAVPSIISGIAMRREGSSATTVSLDNDIMAQFSLDGVSAAGTIRSRIGTSVDQSADTSGSSASSIREVDQVTVEEEEHDENDQLSPLAATGSNSSRLFDGLRSGLDSLRTRAGGMSPRLGVVSEEFGGPQTEHVKLKVTQGGMKYSVTAYYPRRFKDLRSKCGLSENLFIESLSRCTDLNPSGGKSSAAFLMTGDRRFMLKELVTKLGYSELDSLLTFAPRLLDYLMKPERPSLLAKIYGIYTVVTKDLKTGEKTKLDLIVMEHLFHSQTISRQFDLKGIASRIAKPKPGEDAKDSTGWDGDWLTGSVRDQLLIYPHSRTLLLDALSNDVEFLSSNGGIDFSLLVGVDDSQCTLVVGLIDTLGVFNTLKIIEHSAKKGIKLALASDTEVTVCPPSEYAKRFLSAMETYFVAVPDKWSKPPGRSEIESDPRLACPL